MKTMLRVTLVLAAGLTLVILLHLALVTVAAETPTSPIVLAPTPSRTAVNYGGNFRFALHEPTTLDPAELDWWDTPSGPMVGQINGPIVSQIFEGLTKLDDNLEPLLTKEDAAKVDILAALVRDHVDLSAIKAL